ncbi:DUF1330 domain-containing protein [Streptomyces sp. NBC_01275]|uniref:DUF1330 domain-containing protein n=1 Tax=Streptomyces sp. NBC_01275 TaxID=2903807 RepID=UPI0022552130|nr:DUF1330 domain-containing protein [Streptomyces sp. NBC_01275]MCX4767719.1 DUF1330 domain-containing protein [Streptomyces sp. NBC_01275]
MLTEAIKDDEGMAAYSRAAAPSMAESGARPLVVDSQYEVLEGEWHGNRTVVLEFESVEAARAWYDSDAYTAARPLRQAAAESHMVLVSGFEPPHD